MEHPFSQFGSAGLAVSSPRILPISSLWMRMECWRVSAGAVPAPFSNNQNIGVTSTFAATNAQHSNAVRAAGGK